MCGPHDSPRCVLHVGYWTHSHRTTPVLELGIPYERDTWTIRPPIKGGQTRVRCVVLTAESDRFGNLTHSGDVHWYTLNCTDVLSGSDTSDTWILLIDRIHAQHVLSNSSRAVRLMSLWYWTH